MSDIKIVKVIKLPADMSESELKSKVFLGGKVLFVRINEVDKSATVVYEEAVGGPAARSFDGRGDFSLGLKEQIIFPEIDYDKIDSEGDRFI